MRIVPFFSFHQDIKVLGSAEAADVLLGNEGIMYFKPTCIGTTSTRQYCVQNQSRIPLRFEWKMTYAEKQALKVEPETGVILPNENQVKGENLYYCIVVIVGETYIIVLLLL